MEKSFFYDLLVGMFPKLTEKIVAEKVGQPKWSFIDRLDEDYSLDGTFQVLTGGNSTVKADVIPLDSPLPLKSRPSIRVAGGQLPKMGQKRRMNETQLLRARNLLNMPNVPKLTLVKTVFDDQKRAIDSIFETNEELFLQGLSAGACAVEDTENVGTAIRLDYGFLADNLKGVKVLWSNTATAKPITDIRNLVAKSKNDGVVLEQMHLDDVTFANLLATDEAKQAVIGMTGVNFNVASESKIKEYLKTEFGLDVVVVTRVIKYEIDGVEKSSKPWKEGMVTFTTSDKLGKLFYTRVVEADAKVGCAMYDEPNSYILAKKWRTIDPIQELSGAEAMCLPVITDVENIYQLNTKEIQA